MIDERELLEKELERFTPDPGMVERVGRRRERKVRRQRVTAGALGVAIAIAVSVAAVTILQDSNSDSGSTPPPQPPLEARAIYLLHPDYGTVRMPISAPGRVANAERSPVSDQIVFERSDPAGRSQIFVLEPGIAERRLTDVSGGAFDPTWSPDGARIAFAASTGSGEDTDIFVVDADGGPIRRLVGTAGPDGSPDWSPDGTRIVFHTLEDVNEQDAWRRGWGRIWVFDVRTRTLSSLARYDPLEDAQVDPAWSPDGRWIAFSSVFSSLNEMVISTTLRVIRPDGTEARGLMRSDRQIENPSWSPDGSSIVIEVNDPARSGTIRFDWTEGRGDIAIVDVRTGSVRWIQREPPFDPPLGGSDLAFDQPSWGADGILVTLSPASGQV